MISSVRVGGVCRVIYSVRVRGVCSDIQCEGQRGL